MAVLGGACRLMQRKCVYDSKYTHDIHSFIHWGDYIILHVINHAERIVQGLKWALFMSALLMKVKVSWWLSCFLPAVFSSSLNNRTDKALVFISALMCTRFTRANRQQKAGVKVSVALNVMLHNTRFYNLRNCANSDSVRQRGATAALSHETVICNRLCV